MLHPTTHEIRLCTDGIARMWTGSETIEVGITTYMRQWERPALSTYADFRHAVGHLGLNHDIADLPQPAVIMYAAWWDTP